MFDMLMCFAPFKELDLSATKEESVVFHVLADWLSFPPEAAAVSEVAAVLVSIASCALLMFAKYASFLVPVAGLAATA